MTERYQKALAYATEKHEGQYRKGGAPYITHPVAVAAYLRESGKDETYQIAGLFHDLLEDTDAEESEIEALGGSAVLRTVKLLTKEKNYDMSEYIERIKSDPMALEVKAADRLHNLRSAVCADEAFRRRYIAESRTWYMDFSPEIVQAVADLSESLKDNELTDN